MRNLERNKYSLWYVTETGETREVDDNGHYTGAYIPTYSTPTEIKIALYPSTSNIVEQIFGRDASLDMVAISNDVVLDKDGLLFESEPTSDFDTTYDYRVSSISKSLNTINYGLERRV